MCYAVMSCLKRHNTHIPFVKKRGGSRSLLSHILLTTETSRCVRDLADGTNSTVTQNCVVTYVLPQFVQ